MGFLHPGLLHRHHCRRPWRPHGAPLTRGYYHHRRQIHRPFLLARGEWRPRARQPKQARRKASSLLPPLDSSQSPWLSSLHCGIVSVASGNPESLTQHVVKVSPGRRAPRFATNASQRTCMRLRTTQSDRASRPRSGTNHCSTISGLPSRSGASEVRGSARAHAASRAINACLRHMHGRERKCGL